MYVITITNIDHNLLEVEVSVDVYKVYEDSRRQADHVNMDQQIQAMIYAEGRRPHNHCGPAGKQEGLYYLLPVFQFLPYGKAVEYAH